MRTLFKDNMKMPKNAGWLLPGLQVKRWFAMIFFGSILIMLGAMIVFNMRPVYFTMEFIRQIAEKAPSGIVGAIVAALGAVIFFKGWQKTNLSILDLDNEREKGTILESLYRRRKLNRGPKIVAVGGGTGLSMLLKGVKKITNNVTAIVKIGRAHV